MEESPEWDQLPAEEYFEVRAEWCFTKNQIVNN